MKNLDPLMTSARTGHSSKDEWMTPLWLFDLLNQEFDFTLDPAATRENTLCDSYFTKQEDGLRQRWLAGNEISRAFVNPPYSQMALWIEHAWNQVEWGFCDVAVFLVAARTDTRAWWDYIQHGEVRFIKGRLKFESPYTEKTFSAPFPSAVAIFRKPNIARTVYWEVSEPKKRGR